MVAGKRKHIVLIGEWEQLLEPAETYLRNRGVEPYSEYDGDVIINV